MGTISLELLLESAGDLTVVNVGHVDVIDRNLSPMNEIKVIDAIRKSDARIKQLHEVFASPTTKTVPRTVPSRTWTSADGRFTAPAFFLNLVDGNTVHLQHTDNGRTLEVPLDRLHGEDQVWIRQELERARLLLGSERRAERERQLQRRLRTRSSG